MILEINVTIPINFQSVFLEDEISASIQYSQEHND